MTYLGKISYGIYLWHWPAILVLGRVFEVRPAVVAVMALVLAVAMASMSYQLLETPIRRGRVLDPFPWPAVGAGLAVSVLTAAVVVGPILNSDRPPAVAAAEMGDGAAAEAAVEEDAPVTRRLARRVPRNLDFDRISKDKGPRDTYCTPSSSPADCRVVDGDGPHVVLVGDSQARMLAPAFEALAEEKGFTLSLGIVTGCPWQHGVYNTRLSQESQDQCLDARRGYYQRTLPRMEPDVVVFASLARSQQSWEGRVVEYDGTERPIEELLADSTQRTVELVNDAGAKAVMIRSTMGTEGFDVKGFDPLDCLARAERLRDCTVTPPLDRPVADGIYDTTAIGNDEAAVVDINPVFCPDAPACRPILDGEVVWRDENHLTGSITRARREGIWEVLQETGWFSGG
jgi:hypothetical protein